MNSALLNKKLTIEKEVTTTNSVGTPIRTWAFMKATWGEIRFLSGAAAYTEEGTLNSNNTEITVRYDPLITYSCRILHGSQYYKINYIQTVNRKDFMKIQVIRFENDTG